MGKVRNKGGAPLQCSGGVTTMIGVLESNHSRDALRSILKGLRLVSSGLKAECAARLAAHLTEKPELQLSHPWAAAAITKVSNMFRNILKPTLTAPHTPNQHDAHPLAPPQLARSCDNIPNPNVVDTMPAPHDNSRRALFANLDDLTKDPDANAVRNMSPSPTSPSGFAELDLNDLLDGLDPAAELPPDRCLNRLMMTPPSTPVAA